MIKKLLFILMLCFSVVSFAIDENIYSVIIPVQDQSSTARTVAFAQALQIMTERLHADLPTNEPVNFIESYSYITDADQSDMLEINIVFDRQALQPYVPEQQKPQAQRLLLHITNINNLADMNALTADVTHLHGIQSVFIERVQQDQVDLQITYSGSQTEVVQSLLNEPHFISTTTEELVNSSTLNFKWVS